MLIPTSPFDARVVKIYPEADRQKGTVKVEVHILQPDLKIIKPEMSAKVTFLAAVPPSRKPLSCWCRRRQSSRKARSSVWLVRGDAVHRTEITLGREFQDGVEVTQGLSGGEMVIVVPSANFVTVSRSLRSHHSRLIERAHCPSQGRTSAAVSPSSLALAAPRTV